MKDDVNAEGSDANNVIDIIPDDTAELLDVVNLSSQCMYNSATGEVCGLDHPWLFWTLGVCRM